MALTPAGEAMPATTAALLHANLAGLTPPVPFQLSHPNPFVSVQDRSLVHTSSIGAYLPVGQNSQAEPVPAEEENLRGSGCQQAAFVVQNSGWVDTHFPVAQSAHASWPAAS